LENKHKNWLYGLLAIASVTGIYVWYKKRFLRDPMRQIPHSKLLFVSPANGTVVAVRQFDNSEGDIFENKYENEDKIAGAIKLFAGDVDTKGTIISIHMNLDNVHIQRCPLTATLIKLQYTKGDFKNAITKDSSGLIRYENEHCSYLFQTDMGIKYKVVQIAGFIARKIESFVSEGQNVQQGAEIGVIKMGSQVTVILPQDITATVKVGDVVIDGETTIGEL